MRVLLVLGGLFAIVLAALPSSVEAVTYTNVTTDTVLLSDDFEGMSAIGVGYDDDPGTVDFDPVASVGTWNIDETSSGEVASPRQIQVTDFNGTTTTNVSYPGAFQGNNYLWLNREVDFNSAQGEIASSQTTNGDAVHVEWMAYIRDFSGSGPGVFNMFTAPIAEGDRIAGIAAKGDGTLTDDSGLTWTANTWQKWEFDYVVGATTYDLTIDGVSGTSALHSSTAGVGGSAGAIRFSTRSPIEYFVDAVPDFLQLEVNPLTGMMQITNPSGVDDWSTYFYRISGEENSLDPIGWNSLDEQNYDAIGSEVGESWDEAGGSDTSVLAEAYLKSSSTLSVGESVSLGAGYNEAEDLRGLTFEYRDADSRNLFEGTVVYVEPGDMNGDGQLDDADVNPFVQALTNRAAFETDHAGVDADFVGDFDGNGVLDLGDVGAFKAAVMAAGASAASSVPEPSTCVLLMIGAVGLWRCRRNRSRSEEL